MVVGVLLLVGTGLLYGYGQYQAYQVEQDMARAERLDAATATTIAMAETAATAEARGLATATASAQIEATSAATAQPAPAPPTPVAATSTPRPPTPTPTPLPVVLRRVQAPAIGLDAPVVESRIVNGEWEVPKFVAGHLQGTSLPGAGGNIVLSGHVQSISSGNVFAHIDALKPGDEVVLKTNVGDARYVIEGKNIVPNDDMQVVQPTAREELTLITCTGSFNYLTRDFDKRWVVWGVRAP
jgi:LPXTG-site transpeptidase (sortase) family protein